MEKRIYIVGAHSRGQTFLEYISFLYPKTTVEAFLVDNLSENDTNIRGISVLEISDESQLHKDIPVYLATKGIYHDKFYRELQKLGMKYIIPVSVELDSELRNAYVEKIFIANHRKLIRVGNSNIDSQLEAKIYVATSIYDKALKNQYQLNKQEVVIQVGAALTEQRLFSNGIVDCSGENISNENKQFCELTALYWIWKNAKQDIVGLVHYRRHFLLPKNWQAWMEENKVDVILPIPLYVAPNLEDNYKKRHVAEDWIFMMNYLQKNNPEDYEYAKSFFRTNLYSPCNMFIMRKEVLNDLCTWLFPILDAVVAHGGQREDIYQNRYPGFLSERLITFFFDRYQKKYKVAYANKNFLK